MHPMLSADVALSKGYTLIVMEIGKIASDDTAHNGAFYDLYPYEADAESQTGALMAWAWGTSKVLDTVYEGLDKSRYYFVIAAYMNEDWVNAPSMWKCYKRADSVYEKEGLSDHLAVHFHKEGHAVIAEDMELIIRYFDKMYYKIDTGLAMDELKTTAFL